MKTHSDRRMACIYARVSTTEQEKEGFSIQAQQKLLRKYAATHGFTVVHEFVESETAKSTGRPAYNSMLSYMRKHGDCRVILVEKTDRLTRNMADFITLDLENTGIEVHMVRENKVLSKDSSPSEFFMQDIQVAMAVFVSKNISAEAKKGMRAKAEEGLYPSVAPIGYTNTVNAQGVKVIVPDPVTAPLVTLLFEKYSIGNAPLLDLSKEMHELGMRSKRGNMVGVSTIHKMLRNPIYRGKFIWKGIEYDGSHTPLVTSALWFKVQDVLAGRSVEKPKQRYEFPYTGLMKCGECGCAITAERRKGKYSYYHCTEFKGKHNDPYVREEKLDMQFSHILKGLRIDDSIAQWIVDAIEANTADTRKTLTESRARLEAQRKRLRNRSEVLYDDRLDGRIDVTLFDKKSAEIRREIELIDEQLDSLDSDPYRDILSKSKGILELAHNAHRLYLEAPGPEKRQLLQNLLWNCTLERGTVHPEFAHPLGVLFDTNAKWKASGAVSSDLSAVHSIWHPVANSNLVILCGKPG